jgi:GNAT superfamily N-acetyltransferase
LSAVTIAFDDSAETAKAIRDGLTEFNRKAVNFPEPTPVNVAVRDASGALHGGVVARVTHDTLYIDIVWIDEVLRGGGHGRAMSEQVEGKARALGARIAWLYTLSWQARPFYEKPGYRVFGEMPFADAAHHRYFMRKDL